MRWIKNYPALIGKKSGFMLAVSRDTLPGI